MKILLKKMNFSIDFIKSMINPYDATYMYANEKWYSGSSRWFGAFTQRFVEQNDFKPSIHINVNKTAGRWSRRLSIGR